MGIKTEWRMLGVKDVLIEGDQYKVRDEFTAFRIWRAVPFMWLKCFIDSDYYWEFRRLKDLTGRLPF